MADTFPCYLGSMLVYIFSLSSRLFLDSRLKICLSTLQQGRLTGNRISRFEKRNLSFHSGDLSLLHFSALLFKRFSAEHLRPTQSILKSGTGFPMFLVLLSEGAGGPTKSNDKD